MPTNVTAGSGATPSAPAADGGASGASVDTVAHAAVPLTPAAVRGEAPAPPTWARRALLSLAGLLYVTGTIGSNVGPAWIDERPVVVLLLSARNRNLFASVPYIDPLPYALIGFTKVVLVGFVLYYVGHWFGEGFLRWSAAQLGELPSIYRWFQRGIDRAGWLLVLLMPGSNLVCLMAGYRRMSLRVFGAMMVLGAAAKLVVLWIGGKVFEDQIRSFLDAIERYQWWIVGGLFLVTFVQAGFKARSVGVGVVDEETGTETAPQATIAAETTVTDDRR